MCVASAAAQNTTRVTDVKARIAEAEQEVATWQRRVRGFTKDIVDESAVVSDSERAVYLAVLAKIWWKADEDEARIHLKKSVDKMSEAMSSDDKTDIERRLLNFQKVLEIISVLDEKVAQKLISSLESVVNGGRDEKPNEAMADILVSVGMKVAPVNPKLAAACGFDSLIYGFGTQLPALTVEINLKEGLLAESLARRTLALAKNKGTRRSELVIFNLERFTSEFNKGKPFSESLRRSIVETFIETLATAALIENERPARCGIINIAQRFLPRVDVYFPELGASVRANIQICVPFISETNRERMKAVADGREPKTVDDLLRMARETRDVNLKITYYREALTILEQRKQFEQMISILDGIEGDDLKKVTPVGWEAWRSSASSDAALTAFEANDLPAAYRIIRKTPKLLRPYVRRSLISKSTVAKNKEFLLENLSEMQKEMDSIEFPATEAVGIYRHMAHLYLNVQPTEAEAMFSKLVKAVNKADSENPEFKIEKDWAIWQDYLPMKCELVEVDEQSIATSLNNLSSRRSRVRLKLGFLESSLEKYVTAKKKFNDLSKDNMSKPDSSRPLSKTSPNQYEKLPVQLDSPVDNS